jgi:CcmD family protein
MISSLKKIMVLALILFSVSAFAQAPDAPIEMADGLRQSGKIYVVVTVLAVIFTGIVTYLILLDRKISRLEKENKK